MKSKEKDLLMYDPPYSPKSPCYASDDDLYPQELSAEEQERQEKKWISDLIESSENALKFYNKKHRTNYELVEPLTCYSVWLDKYWTHFNFTAKEKSVSDEELPANLFFGEQVLKKGIYEITTCRLLDGVKQVVGCDGCDGFEDSLERVIHPTSGFKMGLVIKQIERLNTLRPRPPKRLRSY